MGVEVKILAGQLLPKSGYHMEDTAQVNGRHLAIFATL